MRNALVLPALMLLAACAQVREPQGGPKDTAAPQLLRAEPPNGSTRFAGNSIVLHFDERVQLDRVRERLLVSPPLAKAPVVAVSRGTDVVITLAAPLAPNTTYSFPIGEAVKDLSEGNTAAGLTYVVSTGDHVDSLSISGVVHDAFTGLPAPEVLVLLHDATDTGDVRTAPPAYFTRSGTDGSFRIGHLRNGPMRLSALKDLNGNFRYDLPNEEIAFLGEAVQPGDSTGHRLALFRPVAASQYVVAATVLEERGWQLAMARRAGNLELHPLDRQGGRLAWWPEWNRGRDTVVFWPSDTTLLLGQRFVVSEDGQPLDTLMYRTNRAMPFNLVLTALPNTQEAGWRIISSRPVASVDSARAVLKVDTAVVPLAALPDDSARRVIHVAFQATAGKEATLVLYPKAVMAVMGGTNDTTTLRLGTPDPRTLGKLTVELIPDTGIVLPPGPFVLQLLTGAGNVVRERSMAALPDSVYWTGLTPGNYRLKVIQDRNGDGRWTTGAFDRQQQPEAVLQDPEPVTVRAGWVVRRSWQVAIKP